MYPKVWEKLSLISNLVAETFTFQLNGDGEDHGPDHGHDHGHGNGHSHDHEGDEHEGKTEIELQRELERMEKLKGIQVQ